MTTAIEITEFSPREGQAERFETVFRDALPILVRQHGVLRVRFGPALEDDGAFLLIVEWSSLEDHIRRFRESEDFRAFVSGFRPL